MKSLYLVAAAITVVVRSEPQRINSDIIWYPVDDEEGVFISTFGEKHRTDHGSKWRSHRRARYSGTELNFALASDPADNSDLSFSHFADSKGHFTPVPRIHRKGDHRFPSDRQGRRSQGQENQSFHENNFQEITNEVLNYKRHSATEVIGTEWSNGPAAHQDRWRDGGQRPPQSSPTAWTLFFPGGGNPDRRPAMGASGPVTGLGGAEWVVAQSGGAKEPGRSPEADRLVFPDEWSETSVPPEALPTEPPTPSPCERACPVTPEFNPVCGSDAVTYSNAGRLKCAKMCGKDVRLSHYGNCGRTPLVTPLVSNNSKRQFSGFPN